MKHQIEIGDNLAIVLIVAFIMFIMVVGFITMDHETSMNIVATQTAEYYHR